MTALVATSFFLSPSTVKTNPIVANGKKSQEEKILDLKDAKAIIESYDNLSDKFKNNVKEIENLNKAINSFLKHAQMFLSKGKIEAALENLYLAVKYDERVSMVTRHPTEQSKSIYSVINCCYEALQSNEHNGQLNHHYHAGAMFWKQQFLGYGFRLDARSKRSAIEMLVTDAVALVKR